MARPVRITDEQILEAAQQIFSEQGLDATTFAIAQHAGISEGTIFKRFKTKENLFVCAVLHNSRQASWLRQCDELLGQGDMLENLETITTAMLSFFMHMVPRVQMMMARHNDLRERIMKSPHAPPIESVRILRDFLDAEQRADRLLPHDSELLARLLIASIHHFAFMETAGMNAHLAHDADTYVRETVRHHFAPFLPPSTPT